jgi:aminopeptidase N
MEYAMATMVQNHSINTAIHEWMHSWYQHLLGTNENRYPWMDEGFTSFAEGRIMAHAKNAKGPTHFASFIGYQWLSKSNFEEALITNANHLNTNYAYNYGSYSKGAMFLVQLGYITGEANLKSILIEYYNKWKFKSPEPDDFVRVAEKVSKMELDWFKEYWINTTKTIDYKIDTLLGNGNETVVKISRTGQMPMPLDVMLTFADGTTELHYFPMDLMFGEKPAEDSSVRKLYPPHRWTNKEILLKAGRKLEDVIKVEIDPSMRMADTDIKNNKWERK